MQTPEDIETVKETSEPSLLTKAYDQIDFLTRELKLSREKVASYEGTVDWEKRLQAHKDSERAERISEIEHTSHSSQGLQKQIDELRSENHRLRGAYDAFSQELIDTVSKKIIAKTTKAKAKPKTPRAKKRRSA